MKKTIFTLSALALALSFSATASAQTVEDVNVSLSNLNSNNYFDSYDDNTKTVNNLNFEVLSDGSNSNNFVTPFAVKVYIWDGSNPHFVKTYNVNNMNELSALDYSNQTVDLSSLQLPAGTYRLGVYVDANDDIPNPPDDPSDNAYLLQGNINFTPGSPSSIKTIKNQPQLLSVFPNPATNNLTINWAKKSNSAFDKITIKTIEGQLVKKVNVAQGQNTVTINISNLPKGVYIISARTNNTLINKKFVKD